MLAGPDKDHLYVIVMPQLIDDQSARITSGRIPRMNASFLEDMRFRQLPED